MITADYKSTPGAFVYTNGQWHLLPLAAFAAYLARVSWVHSFKPPASVFSFAFRYREKASPGHVADCSGEMAILHHPADLQIFDSDRVKSSDQISRYLMVKIVAERCARDLVARDPLGKGGVVDLAGVFKFALTAINKLFVSAESKLESFDCGIFGISQLRAMPQSLSLLAKPDERLQGLISAFHLYHNRPIDNTEKFGRERAANAINSIALAHLHSASLQCRGRWVVPRRSATTSLHGSGLWSAFLFGSIGADEGQLDLSLFQGHTVQ